MGYCVGSKGTIACDISKRLPCSYNPNFNLTIIKHAEQLSCSVEILCYGLQCVTMEKTKELLLNGVKNATKSSAPEDGHKVAQNMLSNL